MGRLPRPDDPILFETQDGRHRGSPRFMDRLQEPICVCVCHSDLLLPAPDPRRRLCRVLHADASARGRVTVAEAPWPVVRECHYPAPSLVAVGHTCPQCDGSHDHDWVGWPDAPRRVTGGPGLAVRCRVCGGRKCDHAACRLRRHHRGPHDDY